MIKVENVDVWGFEHAIRGMRNPMNSWSRSDTVTGAGFGGDSIIMGDNDLDLMKRLFKAGTEHRKYLRQIFVSMDITAPLYWWKQMDQYKIGTVTNSCSTMHRIAEKSFDISDFSYEHLLGNNDDDIDIDSPLGLLTKVIEVLNDYRKLYLEYKDKCFWWQLIQLLPSSYNQKRTVTMNYENVLSMIKQRTGHKLDEWNIFVERLLDLPYIKEIMN